MAIARALLFICSKTLKKACVPVSPEEISKVLILIPFNMATETFPETTAQPAVLNVGELELIPGLYFRHACQTTLQGRPLVN